MLATLVSHELWSWLLTLTVTYPVLTTLTQGTSLLSPGTLREVTEVSASFSFFTSHSFTINTETELMVLRAGRTVDNTSGLVCDIWGLGSWGSGILGDLFSFVQLNGVEEKESQMWSPAVRRPS
jgi:hypothetical protein